MEGGGLGYFLQASLLTGDTLCALTTTVRSRKSMGGTGGLFLLVFFKPIQANTAYLDYMKGYGPALSLCILCIRVP